MVAEIRGFADDMMVFHAFVGDHSKLVDVLAVTKLERARKGHSIVWELFNLTAISRGPNCNFVWNNNCVSFNQKRVQRHHLPCTTSRINAQAHRAASVACLNMGDQRRTIQNKQDSCSTFTHELYQNHISRRVCAYALSLRNPVYLASQ